MEARELRIGNFLYYKDTNDLGTVELIHKNHYECRDEFGIFTPNCKYNPIPLTKEWFEKFGFEKADNDYKIQFQKNDGFGNSNYWIYVDTGIDNESNEFIIQLVSEEGDWFTSKNKYVHQLQNLYFALTNEELTIKNQE